MSDPDADPIVEAEIERALRPYLHLLPEDALDEMRATLREVLVAHPRAHALVSRLRPPPVIPDSDEHERLPNGGMAPKKPTPKTGAGA